MNKHKHDLPDDELDHLFRDSAEKMDFDFDPDSWTKMSQKLDAANLPASGNNQAKNIWLKRGLSVLLALLFIIGGYYSIKLLSKQAITTPQIKHKNNVEIISKTQSEKHVATDKVGTDSFKNDILAQNNSLKKGINNSESIGYKNKKTKDKITIATKTENNEETLANNKVINSSKSQKSIIAKNENSVKLSANQTFTEHTKTSKIKAFFVNKSNDDLVNTTEPETSLVTSENDINNVSEKNRKGVKTQNSKTNLAINNTQTLVNQGSDNISLSNVVVTNTEAKIERWQLGDVKNLISKKAIFKSNLPLPIIAFESPKAEFTISTSPNTAFKSGLNFRFAISPDFSVIPRNSFAKIGNNGAVILEYRFNKHWSLQTGVIRSLKRYIATPEQYNWNTNWNNPTPLVFVDATCKMLDIPLNFRYDITQKANSRLFASSGFTSYIMLKEVYRYNYKDNANPNIKYREWTTKTGNYPFSVLNFSLGYERQILRKLSFQAEPFVKIPLGEIAYGKVKLATLGVFFSAKYPIARF